MGLFLDFFVELGREGDIPATEFWILGEKQDGCLE